jgi:hypothetical protein
MRLLSYVELVEEMKNEHSNFFHKTDGKIRRHTRTWMDNVKTSFTEKECADVRPRLVPSFSG